MQLQAWKVQYASLWKFKGSLDDVNVKTFVHSPKLEINKPQQSIFSPSAFSKGQNWLTATTSFDKQSKMIHTEAKIKDLVEQGALTLDKDLPSLSSVNAPCSSCIPTTVCVKIVHPKSAPYLNIYKSMALRKVW